MAMFEHYHGWNMKRLAAMIEWFGADWFRGKRVLEIAAGHGEMGGVLWTLGADVTFTDGREENAAQIRARLPIAPEKVIVQDAEEGVKFADGRDFDLILHLGVLYHLDNWQTSLADCAKLAPYVVLESEVCDSSDVNVEVKLPEPAEAVDQALRGMGSRPSAEMIEKVLTDVGLKHQRLRDNRCNSGFHIYDWQVTGTNATRNGLRRFWFCGRDKIKP